MKTVNNSFTRSLVLAQTLLLLCTNICPLVAIASTKSDLDYADLNKLAGLETVIYGSAHKNLPNNKRIDSLEKILFGKTHNGSLHSRIYAIASTVNGRQENSLAPPQAPALDRSDTFKTEAPPIAPENDWQGDQNDMPTSADSRRDRISTLLQQAMQFYSQGQTNQAEAIFKNVLSLDNKNSDANFNLGAIAEGRNDWQEALRYYQAALLANPNDDEIRSAVKSMQLKVATMNKNSAKPAQARAPKLSNQQVAALKARVDQAGNDYEKGNYDSAIANLKIVIAQAPDQADVYFALGQAYKAKRMNSDAKDAFNQAIRLDPNNKDYQDALAALPKSAGPTANSENNYSSDTFATDNSDLSQKPKTKQLAQNGNNSADADGEITPFSDQGNSELGWQSTGAANNSAYGSYYMPGMTASYVPAYAYSNSIPYNNNMTYRIERAAIGGIAGAAIGSMFAPRGYRMGGAFSGGMMGGMMGLMGGGRRW